MANAPIIEPDLIIFKTFESIHSPMASADIQSACAGSLFRSGKKPDGHQQNECRRDKRDCEIPVSNGFIRRCDENDKHGDTESPGYLSKAIHDVGDHTAPFRSDQKHRARRAHRRNEPDIEGRQRKCRQPMRVAGSQRRPRFRLILSRDLDPFQSSSSSSSVSADGTPYFASTAALKDLSDG